jgi:hypothetical protein
VSATITPISRIEAWMILHSNSQYAQDYFALMGLLRAIVYPEKFTEEIKQSFEGFSKILASMTTGINEDDC